jgi:uncharacterized protein YgbK (DUF1537 family)
MKNICPAYFVDGMKLGGKRDIAKEALEWAKPILADGPVLIYSSVDAVALKKIRRKHGIVKSRNLVEECLAKISKGLVKAGVGQLILAGSATSGETIKALKIRSLRIDPKIDVGVPWTMSLGERPIHLALKGGSFGDAEFFTRALQTLK